MRAKQNEVEIYRANVFSSGEKIPEGNPALIQLYKPWTPKPCPADLEKQLRALTEFVIEEDVNNGALISPRKEKGHFDIRYVSRSGPVQICGHATLGAAHCLLVSGKTDYLGKIHFFYGEDQTFVGSATDDDRVTITFPRSRFGSHLIGDVDDEFFDVLCMPRSPVFKSDVGDWIVKLDSHVDLRAFEPNFDELKEYSALKNIRGVAVTCPSLDDTDTVFDISYCAPLCGIKKDICTSAAVSVANIWSNGSVAEKMHLRYPYQRGATLEIGVCANHIEVAGKVHILWKGAPIEEMAS